MWAEGSGGTRRSGGYGGDGEEYRRGTYQGRYGTALKAQVQVQ